MREPRLRRRAHGQPGKDSTSMASQGFSTVVRAAVLLPMVVTCVTIISYLWQRMYQVHERFASSQLVSGILLSCRGPATCYAIAYPISIPSRKSSPPGDWPRRSGLCYVGISFFWFPVSFLSCHLKPPHLQTSQFQGMGGHGSGWGVPLYYTY